MKRRQLSQQWFSSESLGAQEIRTRFKLGGDQATAGSLPTDRSNTRVPRYTADCERESQARLDANQGGAGDFFLCTRS